MVQVSGARSGPAVTSTAGTGAAEEFGEVRPRQATAERGGDSASSPAKCRSDQLGAGGGHQGNRVSPPDPELVEKVRVVVDVGQELAKVRCSGSRQRAAVGQHADRGAVRPPARRPGEQRVGRFGRAALAERYGSTVARSSGVA
jgi:hypothetical protein